MAEKKVTYLCVVRLLLDSTTVLEGLVGGRGVFHTPATDLSSAFERSDVFKHQRRSGVAAAPQSPKGGCLVTPRRRLPSAADEEWYSPKRPSSTVVESNSSLTTQR